MILSLPLRWLVPMTFLLAVAVMTVYAALVSFPQATEQAKSMSMTNLRSRLLQEQGRLSELLLENEYHKVKQNIFFAASDPRVEDILIVDRTNTVLFAANRRNEGKPLAAAAPKVGADPIARVLDESGLYLAEYPETYQLVGYAGITGLQGEVKRKYALILVQSYERTVAQLTGTLRLLLAGIGAVILALSALLLGFFHFHIGRRLTRLIDATGRFAHGDMQARASLSGSDEFARLSQAFDRMAEEVAGTHRDLERAREEADVANNAKSAFLANTSHELRTPLNAIIGFSEIIRDETMGPIDNARYPEYASAIHRSGQHLLWIINNILDVARIEAGKTEVNDGELTVADVIEEARLLVPGLQDSDRLILHLPADLPKLRGDKRLLVQCLVNLLSNAVKFSDDQESAEVTVRLSPLGEMIIDISDNGIGMSESEIETAMEPFGQVNNVVTRTHQGTGLGLPLVKRLIELHDGQMKIESTPGRGTTVSLVLPPSRVVWGVGSGRVAST